MALRRTFFGTYQTAIPRSQSTTVCFATQRRQKRSENVPGPFWVDETCIDCDTCRWMAHQSFSAIGGASAVTSQPTTSTDRQAALQALIACPTYSIHVDDAAQGELAAARDSFPLQIPEIANCYHLGWHDEKTYGAASYLIHRAEGNIMIDVPRWSPQLAQKLQHTFGGVKYIVLTHRDDVGAHAKWAEHFAATRVLHSLEVNARQGTDAVELKLEGEGPWSISSSAEDEDAVEVLFVPGHTAGHIAVLYKPSKVLFTGDHLAYSARLDRLTIFRKYNWFSVSRQLESVAKLVDGDWLHVLPGHGRRWSAGNAEERNEAMMTLLREEGYATS